MHNTISRCYECCWLTLGVQEGKQLSAKLSVGHSFPEEGFLLSQLLRPKVFCLSSHPLVVVQHSQEGGVGGPGEQSLLIQVEEQTGAQKQTHNDTEKGECKQMHQYEDDEEGVRESCHNETHGPEERSFLELVWESSTRAWGSMINSDAEALFESREYSVSETALISASVIPGPPVPPSPAEHYNHTDLYSCCSINLLFSLMYK